MKIKPFVVICFVILLFFTRSYSYASETVRAVMAFEAKILDPVWTDAKPTRNHGYMIYDTLFALDASGEVRPQMVDSVETSPDAREYTFRLREGLLWHDGTSVTAEDCVASIRRWAAKDPLGTKLMAITSGMEVKDARTFTIRLAQPTGQLLFALAKPSSYAPFMMPKRVAETDPSKQITDFTGSGPFVFRKDEWKPGQKSVYARFGAYKPRSEPASGLAGGKVVKVDRVEWIAMPDPQTQVNALLADEIDYIEMPLVDLLPILREDKRIRLVDYNPVGVMLSFRFNHITKPFDDPKVRAAAWYALNQKDFMAGAIGDARQYELCRSMYACGTRFSTNAGMEGRLASNFVMSRKLLADAGYDGTPVVLIQWTGLGSNVGPIAKSLLERGGFKVDMQSSDMGTWTARRNSRAPSDAGGWSAFMTSPVGADTLNPLLVTMMDASCDAAQPGWPCDRELEAIRQAFMAAAGTAEQKTVAEAAQKRAIEISTHVPLGQFRVPIAARDTIDGVLRAPVPVFWNIDKQRSGARG